MGVSSPAPSPAKGSIRIERQSRRQYPPSNASQSDTTSNWDDEMEKEMAGTTGRAYSQFLPATVEGVEGSTKEDASNGADYLNGSTRRVDDVGLRARRVSR